MAQTILVVDDDPVQRRLLETAITRSGMNVVTAPGGGPARKTRELLLIQP